MLFCSKLSYRLDYIQDLCIFIHSSYSFFVCYVLKLGPPVLCTVYLILSYCVPCTLFLTIVYCVLDSPNIVNCVLSSLIVCAMS